MLSPGTRLGPYEIAGLVGEGGMGQVYRARDTRLDRAVAIKMLPAALAQDSVRRERFEREARSISRLEHPNICPLYDVGEHEGHLYLVMQLLDGETLADKLRSGPLPIKQALEYGVQIAEALAAAHRAEIVHRDLKPGNVMLTRTGVRLLDFGLARSAPGGGTGGTTAGGRTDFRAALTTEGTILGTLSYMAPEQIDGRPVDTRADVFAFGAVMFEMVTGMKAFEGESAARVMSAILRDEPTRVSSIVPVTPAALEALIHACLAKDPNDRWQNIADVARQLRHLRDMMTSGHSGAISASGPRPAGAIGRRSRVGWVAVAAGLAVIVIAAAFAARTWFSRSASTTSPQLHASILPPAGMFLTDALALSPDGTRLVFVAADLSGRQQLWMRPLAASVAEVLEGTANASDPFWSADGQHVAFFAQGKLKRIAANGGNVIDITDVSNPAGGSWNADDVILFARLDGPLMRVNAGGGRAEPMTTIDATLGETHHLYPTFLPDDTHYVFYVNSRERGLYLAQLGVPGKRRLFDPDPALPAGAAATPGVYANGHLLYVRDRVLMARAFDPEKFSVGDQPRTIVETVDYDPPGQAAFTFANDILIFRARQHRPLAELVWLDRQGKPMAMIDTPPGSFRTMALSPDGRSVALDRRDAQGLPSVWVVDTERASSTRLTAAYWAADPVWSADGRTLAYSIAVDSPPNIVLRPPGNGAAERRLTRSASEQHRATGFTPDGQQLVFHAFSGTTGADLYMVPTRGENPSPQRLLQTRNNEHSATVSPDGRWVAYVSDESGQNEVYVSRFPEMQGALAVSTGGATHPRWRRDGKELYVVASGGRVMAITVSEERGAFRAATPIELFRETLYADAYAPDARGERFLIARPAATAETVPLEIVTSPFR
jgi:Tol biopolymer transport system component